MPLNPVEFAQIVPLGETFGLEASPDLEIEDREANSVEELMGKLVMNLHCLKAPFWMLKHRIMNICNSPHPDLSWSPLNFIDRLRVVLLHIPQK